jgi:hypothetical protein
MQYRPTAGELLTDVATLLESEVLEAVSGPLQHRVRVAANLVRIVEREIRLGPAAAQDERHRLSLLLNDYDADLPTLRSALATRLADPEPLGGPFEQAVYDSLLATARDDIAIAKPGYAEWKSDE